MKFYLEQNVFEAALERIRWLFDEFRDIVVCYSGGKDSVVVLQLALTVAAERSRLPLRVLFVDQEAEWQCVVDHVRDVMSDPRVLPMWLQCPIRLFNATSHREEWLFCWQAGADWIRPKEHNSIHVNDYGTDRFKAMFPAFLKRHFGNRPAIHLAGVRCEESPARTKGLTSFKTYKHATWGKVEDKRSDQYTFYPLYDWSVGDVWKAIHDNGWPYCKLYDLMYQHGYKIADMRVSNVHHETAVRHLQFLQEIEPETWDRITQRISGLATVGQLKDQFFKPRELPYMFRSWLEYRDYLLEHLITNAEHRAIFRQTFAAYDGRYSAAVRDDLTRTQIASILVNDYEGTKIGTFRATNSRFANAAGSRGGNPAGHGSEPIHAR